MRPRFTKSELIELRKLMDIIENPALSPSQKRIAMAKFDHIIELASRRTRSDNLNSRTPTYA